jgi:hypothetical protein
MRIRMFVLAVAASALLAGAAVAAKDPAEGSAVPVDGSVPVRFDAELLGVAVPEAIQIDIHNDPVGLEWRPGDPIREIPRQHWDDPAVLAAGQRPPVNEPADRLDWLAQLQRDYEDAAGRSGMRSMLSGLNFEGAPGTTLPPDPSGDIGATHYVQAVNASGGTRVRVYDKTDGAMVANFILTSTLQGSGVCNSGLGDPIVFYDGLADRWVLTEFSPQSGRALCVYVSSTGDPTNTAPASWFRYTFVMPSFPDYPKYGVWSDGYYVAANESGTSGQRPMYVFERAQMLAGQPARFIRITVPNLTGFSFQLLTPAHHIGSEPPPAGAGGIFMRHLDDEAHRPGSNNPTQDLLQLWQLSIDWTPATPGSTLTGPVEIPIAEFNSRINGLTAFNAFPQPNGQRLDPLREPIMNQMVYRNFGTHETIFGNLTTNLLTDPQVHGAVRWFELRRVGGIASPWQLHQEGTYGPNDADGNIHRWMAASAMDSSGNVAVAYSVTRQSPGVFPGLRFVGRLADDPLGVMTVAETEIVAGSRSQSADRWGDYHQMGVDPVDGCTFWFTGEYMGPAGTTNNTRVASFRHEACGDPTFTVNAPVTAFQVCAASPVTLDPIGLVIGSVNDFVDPVELGFNPALPTGFSGNISPTQVTPPGVADLALTIDPSAGAGISTVVVEGVSGAIVKNREFTFNLATALPSQAALASPANGAINISTTPTLSWTASSQAQSYQVEVASDAAFNTIVFTQTVNAGTSVALTSPLSTSTDYYWRVRSANICGNASYSVVRQFRTQSAPGDCDVSQDPTEVFTENFNAGAGGFTVGGTGASNWTLSAARPSPLSGGNAFRATNIATVSDQQLTSPAIVLPADEVPLTLRYQNWRQIEQNGAAGCYDGGILEISVAGGAFTQVPALRLLNDPYRGAVSTGFANPIGGLNAWCDDPARPYSDTLVDLSPWAGSSVRLRWRLGTDSSVAKEGWYVDDVRVTGCAVDNSAPQFTSSPVTEASQGSPYSYSVSATDDDGDPISFSTGAPLPDWLSLVDNGDGTALLSGTPQASDAGTASITLRASDGSLSSDQMFSIDVNGAPSFSSTPVLDASAGVLYSYTLVATDPNPGDSLSIEPRDPLPAWLELVDNGDGTATLSGTPAESDIGSFDIAIEVSDGSLSGLQEFTVTVTMANQPPVATELSDDAGVELVAYARDVAFAFTDPDDDVLSFSATGLPASLQIDATTGVISGTPVLGDNGDYTITVRATDPDGLFAESSFVLSIEAASPQIFRDGFED